eukprot:228563_1
MQKYSIFEFISRQFYVHVQLVAAQFISDLMFHNWGCVLLSCCCCEFCTCHSEWKEAMDERGESEEFQKTVQLLEKTPQNLTRLIINGSGWPSQRRMFDREIQKITSRLVGVDHLNTVRLKNVHMADTTLVALCKALESQGSIVELAFQSISGVHLKGWSAMADFVRNTEKL